MSELDASEDLKHEPGIVFQIALSLQVMLAGYAVASNLQIGCSKCDDSVVKSILAATGLIFFFIIMSVSRFPAARSWLLRALGLGAGVHLGLTAYALRQGAVCPICLCMTINALLLVTLLLLKNVRRRDLLLSTTSLACVGLLFAVLALRFASIVPRETSAPKTFNLTSDELVLLNSLPPGMFGVVFVYAPGTCSSCSRRTFDDLEDKFDEEFAWVRRNGDVDPRIRRYPSLVICHGGQATLCEGPFSYGKIALELEAIIAGTRRDREQAPSTKPK